MYYVFICDSEKSYIKYVEKIILSSGFKENEVRFYEFETGNELVSHIDNKEIICDLLILDIKLPDMSGESAAKLFRERFSESVIVFLTNIKTPSIAAFNVMAHRYLIKSSPMNLLIDEMVNVIQMIKKRQTIPYIIGHYRYETFRLRPEEILYIEIAKHGSKIKLCPAMSFNAAKGSLMAKKKLGDLYEILKGHGFEYAHNSYIVNLNYVKRITPTQLEFTRWSEEENSIILSVSRSKSRDIRERFVEINDIKVLD